MRVAGSPGDSRPCDGGRCSVLRGRAGCEVATVRAFVADHIPRTDAGIAEVAGRCRVAAGIDVREQLRCVRPAVESGEGQRRPAGTTRGASARRGHRVTAAIENHTTVAGVPRTKAARKARREGAGHADGSFCRRAIDSRLRQRRPRAEPWTQYQEHQSYERTATHGVGLGEGDGDGITICVAIGVPVGVAVGHASASAGSDSASISRRPILPTVRILQSSNAYSTLSAHAPPLETELSEKVMKVPGVAATSGGKVLDRFAPFTADSVTS